jgi:hypothetical protein
MGPFKGKHRNGRMQLSFFDWLTCKHHLRSQDGKKAVESLEKGKLYEIFVALDDKEATIS